MKSCNLIENIAQAHCRMQKIANSVSSNVYEDVVGQTAYVAYRLQNIYSALDTDSWSIFFLQ